MALLNFRIGDWKGLLEKNKELQKKVICKQSVEKML